MLNGRLRGLTGQRIVRALSRARWRRRSSSGKHLGLENPEVPGVKVTVPIHGGRELPIKTVLSIIRQARLTIEELRSCSRSIIKWTS